MFTINSVHGKNLIHLEQYELPLNDDTVIFITGKNKRSKIKGRNNGAGKTLCLSPIANILMRTLASHDKNKRLLKHSMYREGTETTLDVTDTSGCNYLISKNQPRTAIQWNVMDEGKSMEFATAGKAEDWAAELSGLNEEEFFSTVFLDSRRPFLIQSGTATDRLNYFNNLFRLDDFDLVKTELETRAKAVSTALDERKVLLAKLEDVTWINTFDITTAKESALDLQEKSDELTGKSNSLHGIQSDLETLKTHKPALHLLGKKEEIAAELKQQTKLLKKYNEYVDYVTELGQYKSEKEGAEAELKTFVNRVKKKYGVTTRDALDTKISKYVEAEVARGNKISKITSDLSDLSSDHDFYSYAVSAFEELALVKKPKLTLDVIDSKLAELEGSNHELKLIIKGNHTGSKSDKECPTCKGEFTKEQAKNLYEDNSKEITELQVNRDVAEEYNEKVKATHKYSDTNLKEAKQMLKSIASDHEIATAKKEEVARSDKDPVDVQNMQAYSHEWAGNISSLEAMVKPDKVEEVVLDKKKTKKRIEELSDQSEQAYAVNLVADEIKRAQKHSKKYSRKDMPDLIEAAMEKVLSNKEQLTKVEVDIDNYNQDSTTYQLLDKQIKALNEKAKETEVYNGLIGAYGKNGIKLLTVQNICKEITKSLNADSHLLFPEPFEFDIEVGPNQFDIIVHRSTATGEPISSDIKLLSGAEGKAFALLWFKAIVGLLPSNRRFNLVILDEAEANLDAVTRELLLRDFIPELKRIIPTIVFVSPYGDIRPGCNYKWYEVEKSKRGKSTLSLKEHVEH